MRDLLVLAMVLAMLPASVRRPFVGLIVFSWLAYMRPQDLCWGFARTLRLSFVVGVAMIAGWWAYEQGKRRFAVWDTRSVLMGVLLLLVSISYAGAQKHETYHNTYFLEYAKIVVIALFTTAQIDSRQRLRVMLWTIALSLGFFGVKNGLLGALRGGTTILRGPGGMLEDNNDFALALVMNVPLLWYLGAEERARPWVRRGTLVAVALSVVTILLTHSRGGFLALTGTALWIAWRSGQLVRATLVLVALALLFPVLAPASVLERLSSISDTADSSRNARLTAWATAMRMITDNPLLGVGLRNFQERYAEYSVVPLAAGAPTYVAHNSYLQIWAESGTLAFVVYGVLLASTFAACRRVFALTRGRPDLAWAANYARMMEATMIGFLIGAFFLSRGQFDLIYHWLAIVTALLAVATAAWRAAPVVAGQEGAAATAAGPASGPRKVAVRFGRRLFGRRSFDRPGVAGAAAGAAPRWR
jgi:probable O-glycosylation ligase (exosortase A-associated)